MAETKTSEKEQQRTNARQSSGDQSLQSRGGHSLQRRNAYPGLFAVSPFELMRRMSEEMFRTVLGGAPAATEDQGLWAPRIEAVQEGNEFVVRAELPGMNADDVVVEINDDSVTISGERRQEHQEDRGGVVVSEISYGAFSRVIPLPEGVIADSATANFRDGVLEIRMPAPPAEVSRGRRIEIGDQSQGQSQSGGQSQASGQGQSTGQGQTSSQGQGSSQSQSGGSRNPTQSGGQSR